MKLSTKGRFGTRVLLDLAVYGDQRMVLLKDVAKRQQISLRYLEHIITPLISSGMIRSTRGAKGGVTLAKPPEQINLLEVIQIMEGSTAPVACVDNPGICHRAGKCVTRDVWGELKSAIDGVLETTTLNMLVEKQKTKEAPEPLMYYL